MEMVLVPPLQTLLHPPSFSRWEGQGELVQSQAVLKYAALITHKQQADAQPGVASAARHPQHPRCAHNKSTPSLQALVGKRVVASLLGHRHLVALCFLVISQVSRQGSCLHLQCHPVGLVCRSGSPEWGLEPVAEVLAHQNGATVGCVGPVVRVSLSHPFPAILAGLVGSGSG